MEGKGQNARKFRDRRGALLRESRKSDKRRPLMRV